MLDAMIAPRFLRVSAWHKMSPSYLLPWALAALCACSTGAGGAPIPPEHAKPLKGSQVEKEKPKKTTQAKTKATTAENHLPWAEETFSPQPGSTPEPELEAAAAQCGTGDAALHEVARLFAEEQARTNVLPDLDFASFHLRRMGSPYVMPRLWSATVEELNEAAIEQSLSNWSKEQQPMGEFRCGAGLATNKEGKIILSFLQVDVQADVLPLPTQVDSGDWLEFQANFLSPTSSATLLLLPPEGPPRRLNPTVAADKVSARITIETAGTWLIQLMATQAGGPRPVAQLLVTADDTPPSSPDSRPVPGEEALDKKLAPEDALFGLINAARDEHGLPPVHRNRSLDRIAHAHSEAMARAGRISHNTGVGDPERRIAESGLTPKATGENVARGGTVVRVHRALWNSPAHRENLLQRRWDEVGVAIVKDKQGALFASELFIDSD
jgi:uncharacterized protein YkwD